MAPHLNKRIALRTVGLLKHFENIIEEPDGIHVLSDFFMKSIELLHARLRCGHCLVLFVVWHKNSFV